MIDIFYFDGKTARKGSIKDIKKLKGKRLWLDVTGITKEEADILSDAFKLHPLTKEDLKINITRVKIEEFNSYMFCVFYGLHKSKSLELIEIDFVVGKNYLITNHFKDRPLINGLKKDMERVAQLFKKGSTDFMFHRILDLEVDGFLPILEELDEEIADVDAQITKNYSPHMLTKILKIKKMLVQLRRTTNFQRDKLSMLRKGEYKFMSAKAIPYFRDIHDHAVRVCDLVESLRESIVSAFDLYMLSVSNRMNEVMKVLSIIATIALPLTVISSIYGTNFRVLPGANNPTGFWIMIIGMGVFSFFLLLLFRKNKWF